MGDKKIQSVEMVAKFSNFQVINKDFTRCRCNILYTGRNRNYSDITDDALNKFIARKGYANVPVVAHLMKTSDGKYKVGGHDSKITISNEGIEIIDECVPFGVIPEDCNPAMDLITERSGQQREYFSTDVILWTHRYPIMEAAFGDEIYFNQSMEISFDDFEYDGDYCVVNDFSMSALCLLNKSLDSNENIEPCFESAAVKKFSIDEGKFKENFELMLETLKLYENKEENSNSDKKGEFNMDREKLLAKLSEFTYENVLGETVAKYSLVDATDTSIGVVDREDNKVYSFDCTEVDGEVVIDTDSKTECTVTYKAISDTEDKSFSYTDEVALAVETGKQERENEISKSFAEEYNKKIDEITATYTQLKAEYDTMSVELEKYRVADQKRIADEKKEKIDEMLGRYAKKLGRFPKFLCYRAKVDYDKEISEIEHDLTIMAGEASMMESGTKNFSYNPSVCNIGGVTPASVNSNKYEAENRYGNLFDKFQ